ncbi:hypothetical protein HJC04_11340 [Rhizobium sp. NLR8a]|uniref:hypothetical protein n=1 Tax=Rhizobium TaxID=379 RepID=UPI001C832A5A|nr:MULTISPECIES: hypothetical protein [Rhizobium]MBX5153222.1 hypothetical protein [Rhizobium lentis]MBX5220895.1 hypothetical protein [Rhizobium sp. NLR8a]
MNAVKKVSAAFSRVLFTPKALPEPEPTYGKPRPATGFFANLTEDQKKRALAYRGDEKHGDPNFAR